MVNKVSMFLQFLLSAFLFGLVWNSGMLPDVYLGLLGLGLLLFLTITCGFQKLKNKGKFIGIVLSILMSIILMAGIVYFMKFRNAMSDIGGVTSQVDNMIVAVRRNDLAENIQDIESYQFGYPFGVEPDNTDRVIRDVEHIIGRKINLSKFSTITDLTDALLSGEIDAAIYNEAFNSVIAEHIGDYDEQIKVIYRYGIEREIKQKKTNIEEPFNVYISGIDAEGPITVNSRSDANIIMTVNPNTRKILLTTTPRDYYVTIPEISGEKRDKLTHAGIYGVDASIATLEEIYGVDINYYVKVNFTSFITIIDALGDVEVESEYTFEGRGHQFQKGINHMDGEAALAFSRERYSFKSGDNQRGKNQESVLKAILQKAMSPAILRNAGEIFSKIDGCVETNMTETEITKLINMQLSDNKKWEIESIASTGTGDRQPCFSSGSQLLYVMWPDENSILENSKRIQQVLLE